MGRTITNKRSSKELLRDRGNEIGSETPQETVARQDRDAVLTESIDGIIASKNTSGSKIRRIKNLLESSESLEPFKKLEVMTAAISASIAADTKIADKEAALAERHHDFRRDELPEILGVDTLASVGQEIGKMIKASQGDVATDALTTSRVDGKQYPLLEDAAPEVRQELLRYFIDRGVLTVGEVRGDMGDAYATVSITKDHKGKSEAWLMQGRVMDALIAEKLYKGADGTIDSLQDVKEIYGQHNDRRKVARVDIETGEDSYKLLPINELRLGHQDALKGIELVEREMKRLMTIPDTEKPDVILVSNLIQSDFSHSRSKKRRVLPIGLDSNNNQFAAAKTVVDRLRNSGIPVVHTLGSDDHQIAQDYTLDVIKELNGFLKDGAKTDAIPYYDQNKLTQSRQYQEHYKFQLDYALPFCYTQGRRLRTVSEVKELTNGRIEKSEYLLIFDHVKGGRPLPKELGIDLQDIKRLGDAYHDGFSMADDVDIVFHTNDGEPHTVQYRHSLDLTAESLKANHVAVARKQLGNLGTMGESLPEILMYGRAQELVHVTSSKATIISLPGLTNSIDSLGSGQYYSRAPGDPSLRANVVRNRFITPTIDTVGMTDDGITMHTIVNKSLMEKADSLPRTAVFELCDFQTGSPTGRPDLQIKYLSYILDVAKEMPVVMQFAGDIIHGNIYPNFSFEGQSVGMIRPESQKLFMKSILRQVFMDVPQDVLDNVVEALIQQGNHDEEQKIRMPGNHDPNIDYVVSEFEHILSPERVRHDAVYHTEDGTPIPTWIAHSHYGAYDINTAHYHITKGAKGDNGGLPAYHAHVRAQGIGNSETPDIILGAHWHNEQLAMIGNTLTVVGGAMAERSEFEDKLGYDAQVAGTCVMIGGGQPVEVNFIHKKRLNKQQIKYGFFTPESLKDHGFHDDKHFNPEKHGVYSHDNRPKSGLQKAVLSLARAASQRIEYEGQLENPNMYKKNGAPKYLNPVTKRMFEVAERLAAVG